MALSTAGQPLGPCLKPTRTYTRFYFFRTTRSSLIFEQLNHDKINEYALQLLLAPLHLISYKTEPFNACLRFQPTFPTRSVDPWA